MWLRLFFILLFLYSSNRGVSQAFTSKHSSVVKVNLVNWMNSFSFSSLDIGYERYLSPKVSIQVEIGVPIYRYNKQGYYTSMPDTSFGKSIGFKSNLELRKYRWNHTSTRRWNMYVAINAAFASHHTSIGMEYKDSSTTHLDNFFLKRSEFGVSPNAGIKWNKKWFTLEIFLGLGYTYFAIQNQHREYDAQIHTLTNQLHNIFSIGETNLSEHQGWRLIPKTGLRFGVRL